MSGFWISPTEEPVLKTYTVFGLIHNGQQHLTIAGVAKGKIEHEDMAYISEYGYLRFSTTVEARNPSHAEDLAHKLVRETFAKTPPERRKYLAWHMIGRQANADPQ